MRKSLALVAACCVLAGTQMALASDGGNSTPTPTTDPSTQTSCIPPKQVYSVANWRDSKPQDGLQVCSTPGLRHTKEHFFLYRHYRQIAPYRCLGGDEGYFAIPCYIIACESGFDWWAMNPSGASYIYQLLGWGAPPPNSFRNRVRNHEIAASLSLSNWACA